MALVWVLLLGESAHKKNPNGGLYPLLLAHFMRKLVYSAPFSSWSGEGVTSRSTLSGAWPYEMLMVGFSCSGCDSIHPD